jgi:hypothetical protein
MSVLFKAFMSCDYFPHVSRTYAIYGRSQYCLHACLDLQEGRCDETSFALPGIVSIPV